MEIRSPADIGMLVRATRADRQMSQLQLARAAGVSRRWLINLEAGKPGAPLDLVLRVLTALNVSLHAGPPSAQPSVPVPAGSVSMSANGRAAARIDLDQHLRRFDRPHDERA